MATVAGAAVERMLLRRRRLPLGDLTNLSSSTPVLTHLKPAARPKPRTSPSAGSSIGSSTAPNTRCPSPPPPRPPLSVAAVIKGKVKSTRELQSYSSHSKKINKISKPKVKSGVASASSPPSKRTRKVTREELPHMEPLDQRSGEPLPSQDFIEEQTRKVTREDPPHMEPLDESSGEALPSQDFIKERRAYFAKIDAFELAEEFVSSGSDAE